MATSPYIAQYAPTIFLGGFWLDDARGIEFQISDPKEPLYGFRDVQFRSVARGQTVVHGILDLNFRFKGYLSLALARGARPKIPSFFETEGTLSEKLDIDERRLEAEREEGNDFRNGVIDPRDLSAAAWRSLLEKPHEEFDISRFVRLSDAMKEEFWDDPTDLSTVRDSIIDGTIQQNRVRAGEWPNPEEVPHGFDLTVVYEHPDPSNIENEQDESLVETIKDVHIMSQSKIIINAVPGGGEAVVERYQFIARDVV